MREGLLACLAIIATMGCGRSDLAVDASTEFDAGSDLWRADAGVLLPEVSPMGRSCVDAQSVPGAICHERGWFYLSRWTTGVALNVSGESRRPLEPVYLDSFAIDRAEVTRADYGRFVDVNDAGVRGPPSECGGYVNVDADYPEIGWLPVAERSGWTDGGTPTSGTELVPVTCVTRTEAMAFCAYRGGRLPTTLEFFRAVRGLYPSQRRFPWGDAPPSLSAGPGPFPQSFLAEYAAVSLRRFSDPPPVATRMLGQSDVGVFDLVGSVSELMLECAEELPELPADGGFLIRPPIPPYRSRCVTGVVFGGDNWYTVRHTTPMIGVSSIFVLSDVGVVWAGSRCSQIEGLEVCLAGSAVDTLGPAMPPSSWMVESKGNDRRSWAIGFRCAYDLH